MAGFEMGSFHSSRSLFHLSVVALLVLSFPVISNSLPCKTANGYFCIFPFYYQSQLYTKCTLDSLQNHPGYQEKAMQQKNRAWCAYDISSTDSSMTKWDYCEEHCSIKSLPWAIILLALGILIGLGMIGCLADYGGYMNACRKIITAKLDGRR